MTSPASARMQPHLSRLPAGYTWSKVWRGPDGSLTESTDGTQMPVDDDFNLSGKAWVCPVGECTSQAWVFHPNPDTPPDPPCCPQHPTPLIRVDLAADDVSPVAAARHRLTGRLRAAVNTRKERAAAYAAARARAIREAGEAEARKAASDMRGHVPSFVASAAVLVGGGVYAETDPLAAAAIGAALATAGLVVAYLTVYTLEWWRARRTGNPLVGRAARRARVRARYAARAAAAAGGWMVGASIVGADPTTIHGSITIAVGALLCWAVNRQHWETLWETRRRLAELARAKADAAARRAAAEALAAASAPPPEKAPPAQVVENDPHAAGTAMAARWNRIAATVASPVGFPMRRTWIVVEETREVTAPNPDTGELVRLGWEYTIQAEPGALVARPGSPPPLVAAKDWLASVLEIDPSKLELVDRPEGQINRGLMMITERVPLGSIVEYKGRAGIRQGSDGSLYGHIGRSLLGADVERVLWVPGQAGGGGRYGVTGSGKSVVTQVSLLNDLYAGIFCALWDGKNFMDFSEFIGVIPMGCTVEHRDVMLQSFRAEMRRRQRAMTLMEGRDRYGRIAPVEALWRPERDGPPQRWTIEEFHMNARDDVFIANLTELVRLQRSTATMVEIATQGGGLADAGNSVLRDQLNQIAMQIMRMGDQQAHLTGYRGSYMPSSLPRLPGMMLVIEADAPAVPVRGAYVHRRDEDGSIYDHLYDRHGQPILTAPVLPPETVEVYEREGLMDLWRMGQGPGGKARLLSESVGTVASVPPPPAAGAARQVKADGVLLAILHRTGRPVTRSEIDGSDGWRLAGWASAPDPSAVSRAGKKLADAGLITRSNGVHALTDAGCAQAARSAVEVFGPDEADNEEKESEEAMTGDVR